jgi:integrase
MPAHHTLEAYLDSYIEAAGIRDGGKAPLFRSAAERTGALTEKPMHRIDAWRMIQRRAVELGLRVKIGCHTFRATGITAYLEVGGTLENAQAMAADESPRTTKLYDRTGDEITLDEVEKDSNLDCHDYSHAQQSRHEVVDIDGSNLIFAFCRSLLDSEF